MLEQGQDLNTAVILRLVTLPQLQTASQSNSKRGAVKSNKAYLSELTSAWAAYLQGLDSQAFNADLLKSYCVLMDF